MNEAIRTRNGDGADPVTDRLRAAGITFSGILEPAGHDPRRLPTGADDRAAPAPRRPTLVPSVLTSTVPAGDMAEAGPMPASRPHGPAGEGLRLIPLSGFHWGGATRARHAPPMPRVRGDHVLIWPATEQVTVDFPRRRQTILAGRIGFVPAGTAFSTTPLAHVRGHALLIPPAWFRDQALPTTFCCGQPAAEDAGLIGPAIMALADGAVRRPGGNDATALQLGLIALTLTRLRDGTAMADAPAPQMADARLLTQRFLDLAQQNLQPDRTMADLARQLDCSLAQLDRACRQSRGRTALELIYDLRMQAAISALRDTARPIPDIAEGLGYAGLGHFMRAFLAATGRSPEAFRALGRITPTG